MIERPEVPVYPLNQSIFVPNRRAGNTTRQVDLAIQLLFEGHCVTAKDHFKWGGFRQANERLFELIIRRLSWEHRGVEFEVDRKKLTIQLI